MSRHKTDPIVMERVRQIIYDTGLSNKELKHAPVRRGAAGLRGAGDPVVEGAQP